MARYSKEEVTVSSGDVAVDNSPGELVNSVVVDNGLQRSLKQRHLQMIGLGGVVG